MREVRFFKCNICGNILGLIKNGGGTLVCCGEPMQELITNTADASREKHVPVITKAGGKVTADVGSVPHPMLEEHYIEWIAIVSEDAVQRKSLKPGDAPKAEFCCNGGDVTVYAYCNLHGLWKA